MNATSETTTGTNRGAEGNTTATANNIAAHETLFRFGIVGDLFTGTMVIFVALALYRLFKGVDQNQAVLMVILGGVLPSAIYFFNVLNDAAAPTLGIRKTSAGRSFHAVPPPASSGSRCRRDLLGSMAFSVRGPRVPASWGCGLSSMVSPIWP